MHSLKVRKKKAQNLMEVIKMEEKKMNEIYEIAILGRVIWQLHSLNNEGTVGNVTEPRSLRIIDPNTKKAVTTDGISGEMLKHIHTEIMWVLDDKKYLCDACKGLNPEKFNYTIKLMKNKPKKVEDAIKQALDSCDICDIHGFLLEKPTASRKSTVEFGWALGIPEIYRDIHTHARHALGEKGKETADQEGEEKGSTSTQMVYHRPTRSGIYAVISIFQPWRICLNEARQKTYTYDADDSVRERRYKLALKAYQIMFTRPEGAMTTTRLPHIEDFSGVIVYSTEPLPVPVISPLKDTYIDEIKKIAANLLNKSENKKESNGEIQKNTQENIKHLNVVEFGNIVEFTEKIGQLINNSTPYKMHFG